MSNVQSYNALIDRFKAFASGHFILKTFSHGQIDTADLEKFTEYPFMHVVPSNVTYAKGTKTFSFQIVLADLPRDKDDKVEFQREVLSDLQRIAEDLVAEITNHRVLFGDLITVQNVSLEPFLEEFHNTLTGWTVSLDLLVPYYWDACSIPAEWNDMFESSTGGTGSILTFIDSITRDEYGNVSLVNDEATPAPNYYYGTNDEGVRGWYLSESGGGLTCETIGSCQTIIDIEAAIDALEEEILLKADITSISAVGFSNDYDDLDNKPTIPTATSELTNDGEDGVNPFITAQDLPSLSGYVPYTGATADVNLGTHDLTATQGTFATSGNPDTLTVNHSSGSGKALTITKGGAGEGIYVNKTSGSGNAVTIVGDLEATTLKKTGGTSSQFLKADGSVDSSTYVPDTRTLTINGTSYDLSADRSWTISASASLAVGTTPITSGTVGRVLFEGTGNVLQEDVAFNWDSNFGRLELTTTNLTSSCLLIKNSTTSNQLTLRAANTDSLIGFNNRLFFLTSTTLTISQAGNVGIGISNPTTKFQVATGTIALNTTSGNTLIGTTIDAGYKLDVNGTARLNGLSSINGAGVANTALAVYGNGNGAGNYLFQMFDASSVQRFYLTASGNFRLNGATDTSTTGTDEKWRMVLNFAPTSGTRQHNGIYLTQTINQTGGANGITRGLYIQPTLTSAADFRAIETTAGNVLFGSNFFWDNTNGRLGIGTATPNYRLHVIGGQTFLKPLNNSDDALHLSNQGFIVFRGLTDTATGRFRHVGSGFQLQDAAFNLKTVFSTNNGFSYINNGGGNVGIGTTTDAGYKLDVNGTARVSGILSMSSATGGYAYLQDTSALAAINVIAMQNVAGNYAILSRSSTGGYVADHYGIVVGSASNSYQRWFTSGSERMRLVANGNLLLNTTTDAGYKLDVNGTARVQGALTVGSNVLVSAGAGVNAQFYNTAGNPFQFGVSDSVYSANGTPVAVSITSGSKRAISDTINFAPTSGTATYSTLLATPTINQTGGANGITRGLYINPTLTAAADFRAIETARGNVVFGNLPTSSAGLPTGAIWNDAGTLKIV